MSRRAALAAFLRAPMRRRLLALEAVAELSRARLVTLLPSRIYTGDLGPLSPASGAEAAASVTPEQEEAAAAIGGVVAGVAAQVPFRALCLQQAIAVRRMLARRGVPARVFLGVSRDPANPLAAANGLAAHAWVEVGGRAVSGGGALEQYAVLARFG